MRADDVPAELVEKAMWAVAGEQPVCAECGDNGPAACVYCKDDAEKYARHALAAVLPLAYAEAMEHAAKRISPYSGIGLAHGATRGDVAVWLLEYAAALRAAETERTS